MKKLIITWIVAADSHKAYFFKKTNSQKPDLAMIHELEAKLDNDHDHPGRTFDSMGTTRHAIEPHTDPRELEKQRFAHDVSNFLDDISKHSNFDNLIIIASPKLLGILDKKLDKQIHKKLIQNIT